MTAMFKDVLPSQTLLMSEQSNEMERSGQKIFKFGFGQSPFSPPKNVMDRLGEYANQHYYGPVQGLPALREAVSAFHKEVDGLSYDPDNILVAPGSKNLLYSAMGAFKEADVLIPAPSWVSYAPQAELWGFTSIYVGANFDSKWKMTPQALEEAVAKKANPNTPSVLILNYPSNPIGVTYSKAELDQLATLFRKHNIWVISDEIYGLLHHDGQHYSLAHSYPERTIITTGLSKWCGGGGWRVGVALLPDTAEAKALKTVMLGIASETYSCNATPIQLAAIHAYDWSNVKDYVAHQRRILKAIGTEITEMLNAANIRTHQPEGGFYVFPDFSAYRDALAAKNITDISTLTATLLEETQAALLPGTAFGLADDVLAARLSYVNFDGNAAIKGSEKVGLDNPLPADFTKTYCARTLEGIKSISDWVRRLGAFRSGLTG